MNQAFVQEMVEGLEKSLVRAGALSDLDSDQLNWKPAAQRWSIAQCLEHTRMSAELYLEKLRLALDRARMSGRFSQSSGPPRPSFIGGLILRAVAPDSRRKMIAPKIFTPEEAPYSEDVVLWFIQTHEDLRGLMVDSADLNLGRIRLSSPVAKIIRLNAVDAFQILVAHAARHLSQAEGVREDPQFPN